MKLFKKLFNRLFDIKKEKGNRKPKGYAYFLKEINKITWPERMSNQVSLAVYFAADGQEYSSEIFAGLCRITRTIWDDMDNPNLQIIADCVCDCYFDLEWGYRSEEAAITSADFERLSSEKEDRLIDTILDRQ